MLSALKALNPPRHQAEHGKNQHRQPDIDHIWHRYAPVSVQRRFR
jgi:hypothetical protein